MSKNKLENIRETNRLVRQNNLRQGIYTEYDLDFQGYTFDNGYGEQSGDLYILVKCKVEREDFDAIGFSGDLETFDGGYSVNNVELVDSAFIVIDQDGGEVNQIPFDSFEDLEYNFGILYSDILSQVQDIVERDME